MDAYCLQVIAHAHVTGCGSEGSVAKRYIATVYGQANWSLSCAFQRHHQVHHPREAEPKPETVGPEAAIGLYQRVRCACEQGTAGPGSVRVGVECVPGSACLIAAPRFRLANPRPICFCYNFHFGCCRYQNGPYLYTEGNFHAVRLRPVVAFAPWFDWTVLKNKQELRVSPV